MKDVEESTFENLQCAIQAILCKESDLGKKESLLFASTPVKYSWDVIP